jgi:prolyl 4-hydroxylase
MSHLIYLFFILLSILLLLPSNDYIIDSFNDYTIKEFPNFLTSNECDYIINLAKKKGLENSSLYEGALDTVDNSIRKSEQVWIFDVDDLFIAGISEKISKITNMPVSHQEALQIVHYGVGGKYEPHHDACREKCDRMNGQSGQRYLTFLIYLNNVENGGGTRFPRIKISIKPERGKAVLFQNVDRETQKIIEDSQHGGDPVISGEKWIANKWIRVQPYNLS